MVGTFLGLFTSFTSEQESAYLSIFRSNYWAAAFPPLTQPMKLAGWLAETHTGRMFAYPFGEARGGSSLTTLCFTVALVALWRRRQFALIVLALGPFGLAFIASVLGRYPYGGSARTMIFVAPMICLLSGLGLAVMIGRLRLARARRLAVFTTALGLAMTGIVMLGLKMAFPYKSIPDQNSRALRARSGPRRPSTRNSSASNRISGWASIAATGRYSGRPFICAIKRSIQRVTAWAVGSTGTWCPRTDRYVAFCITSGPKTAPLLGMAAADVRTLPGSRPPNVRHQ